LAARERNPNGGKMANATMRKFGYPETLIREWDHWAVLLRPAQVTLGSLVLAASSDATAFSALPDEAFAEQAAVVRAIEAALARFSGYERINYLMLMMVDPNVHFHVIPRFSKPREWGGTTFPDEGWPGPPLLKSAIALRPDQIGSLRDELNAFF
jgi:diadenosine tetraphosphate (Ap4A) HIT family hydrolase